VNDSTFRRGWIVAWVVALCGPAFLGVGAADAAPPDRARVAHRLEQIARLTLSGQSVRADADHRIERAYILLDQANQLDPDHAERWLLLAEAAAATDRADAARSALRQYLRLRPGDDVAQLRLIEQLVDAKQTVDDRLAFYRRIAEGPASGNFSNALRSRVAYRAAVLSAEQGDRQQYTRLLGKALQLDPTNKAAAAESFRAIAADPDSSLSDRAAALFTLFQADPTDPATHAMIADFQFTRGFYVGAVDWYVTAERLQAARGGAIDAAVVHNWAMALWGSGRSAAALQLLGYLDPPPPDQSDEADEPDESGQPDGAPADGLEAPPTDAGRAPLETLMLRAVIAAAGADEATVDKHFSVLADRFEQADPADADLRLARCWAYLLCDRNPAKVNALLPKVADEPTRELLAGWLALRTGNDDRAAATLGALADADPRAKLGLGVLAEKRDEIDKALGLYTQVYQARPDDIFGLTAVSHMRRLSASPPVAGDVRQAANLFAAVPADLRNMAANPMKFIQLKLTPESSRYDYGQPINATLELRNVSNQPLSLGPDGAVPTQVLLMPSIRLNRQPGPQLSPVVLDMHRTLMIGPRRSLALPVRLDLGVTSQILNMFPTAHAGLNVVAVLNPRIAPNGKFEPGPLGSAVQTRGIVRTATPPSPELVDRMISQLASTDPVLVIDALGILIPLTQQLPADQPDTAELADRAIEAVRRVFDDLSPMQQAWAVSLVQINPDATRSPFSGLVDQAARSESDLVILTLLATQVRSNDSSMLNAALRRPDRNDPIRRYAEHLRTAIEQAEAAEAQAEAENAENQP